MKQWLVPERTPHGQDGLPPTALIQAIVSAVNEFSPDIIHTWGTEAFWGLLSSRFFLSYPVLLEIQGIKGRCARVFYGGLTLIEQLHTIGIKELLKRRTMHSDCRDFVRWGLREDEMIRFHRFVNVQSSWAASHVKSINPDACQFMVDRSLRQPFYDAVGWQSPIQHSIFCIAAYSAPFKGLHVAIRAMSLLKKRISTVRLRIAGSHQREGIRQDGYMRWINGLILKLGLADNIDWIGPLNADQIVAELKNASAVIIPTFIENCCTSMQEAMSVGTPVVVSYVGGIPSLGKDEESCLFFSAGDEVMCAYQLERLLTDRELALRLSRESRKIAAIRNDRQRVVQQQLEIYRQVIYESKGG